jgi:hypothetical protein
MIFNLAFKGFNSSVDRTSSQKMVLWANIATNISIITRSCASECGTILCMHITVAFTSPVVLDVLSFVATTVKASDLAKLLTFVHHHSCIGHMLC